MSEVTQLLREWSGGKQEARDELLGLVYEPLRAIAGRHLNRERVGHTLQPTALVHELYLKLIGQRHVAWNDRAHFFAVAAQVMRRILVDHARRRNSDKRGGGVTPVTIGAALDLAATESFDVVALDVALEQLEQIFPQQARMVELRFYAGLTIDETAAVLGVSAATISREWTMARAWLRRAMSVR
ncbi:MAG TPA: sigma-70 family RNA polymerase sigma factor [Thermoanaerobaculia bacterium]|jgi:RNA polymerase sigma factor (TIGR02999 family)|nr:sigma-70 family RNA polymerase sigma factor [Thermoanaerobaculia bacterium]